MCATLSCKPPFVLPLGKEQQADAAKRELARAVPSDHLLYAAVAREWRSMRTAERSAFAHRFFIAPKSVEMILKTRDDLSAYGRACVPPVLARGACRIGSLHGGTSAACSVVPFAVRCGSTGDTAAAVPAPRARCRADLALIGVSARHCDRKRLCKAFSR